MKLSDLLQPWLMSPPSDVLLSGIQNDSRCVEKGTLFLAYPGYETDGRRYMLQAVEKGAAAVVYESQGAQAFDEVLMNIHVPCIPLENLCEKISEIAARFYDYPAKKLNIIGVTGTNGKTTIAYLLTAAYELLGIPSVYMGTLGEGQLATLSNLSNTTPDGVFLQKKYHDYLKQGMQQVCMEVSSHALALKRVAGIPFQQAIFTNLSREHLDFHHTMENYQKAKAILFETPGLECAILNHDVTESLVMQNAIISPKTRTIFYGLRTPSEVSASVLSSSMYGTKLCLKVGAESAEVAIQLIGEFNIYNMLAVVSSLLAANISFDKILQVLPQLPCVPGRMQRVSENPCVFVDYAHTPDALKNALATLKSIHKGRLILVFGCGGGRDRGKRAVMGRIASEAADIVIVTNDNPRQENPAEIIADIQSGMLSDKDVEIFLDRKEAIQKALSLASDVDVVLVAGKGHETYQEIGKKRYHFSDREVIQSFIGVSR